VWAGSSYTNFIDTQLHSAVRLISGCLQPTQLSWLPVLSNVAPPYVRRKAATDNMLQIVDARPNWPVYADVFEHRPPQLASWRPIWSDVTSVDTFTQWRQELSSASVVNHTIVTDATIWQPGFNLPYHMWSLMNRFHTCRANLHKWGLAHSPSCDCGLRPFRCRHLRSGHLCSGWRCPCHMVLGGPWWKLIKICITAAKTRFLLLQTLYSR